GSAQFVFANRSARADSRNPHVQLWLMARARASQRHSGARPIRPDFLFQFTDLSDGDREHLHLRALLHAVVLALHAVSRLSRGYASNQAFLRAATWLSRRIHQRMEGSKPARLQLRL